MINCLNCGKENPPSRRNNPRKYCSKKCANTFLYNLKSSKNPNANWKKKTIIEKQERAQRKALYEWYCQNRWSAQRIADVYAVNKATVWAKSKSLGIEGEIILWSGKKLFFTEEEAKKIVTEEIKPEHDNEYLRKTRSQARKNSKIYRKRPKVKKRAAERKKARAKQDPVFRLRCNVSNLVYDALVIKQGKTKGGSTFKHIGYTPSCLKEYIENQFDESMSWGNYGIYWQLDHIIPQAALPYDSLTHPNFKKCWALNNLRPLEKSANASKGSFWNGRRHSYENKK